MASGPPLVDTALALDAPSAKRGPRALTKRPRPLTKEERAEWGSEMLAVAQDRPRTRADCIDGLRPCPYAACEFHMYLDVNPRNGHIKYNFPDLELWELAETCALDVADLGGVTLDTVGVAMNVSRERIRQLEETGLAAFRDTGIFFT